MGPRSILERHYIPNAKSDAHIDAAADACRLTLVVFIPLGGARTCATSQSKFFIFMQLSAKICQTRMHSNRMHNVRCSGHRMPACTRQGASAWGVSVQWGGVSAQGRLPRGCLPRGVSAGGCLPRGCLARGCLLRVFCHTHPLPPVNRMTDTCENITLPQLRCGR